MRIWFYLFFLIIKVSSCENAWEQHLFGMAYVVYTHFSGVLYLVYNFLMIKFYHLNLHILIVLDIQAAMFMHDTGAPFNSAVNRNICKRYHYYYKYQQNKEPAYELIETIQRRRYYLNFYWWQTVWMWW